MKRLALPLSTLLLVSGLILGGCSPAAPPPAPTAAPAKAAEPTKAPAAAPTAAPAPTKAAEPTKAAAPAPTAAPTTAPAKKVDFPTKGKPITYIMPWPAGSASDVAARLLTPLLEKDLGTSFQVVNKPGAGQQVGVADLAMAKPDGYTLGHANLPGIITIYLDPERKATFARKDLLPVARLVVDPVGFGVKADSPYRSMKDLVDAAKANPGTVKIATTGVLGVGHLAVLLLEKETGAKFASVHFDGGAPTITAVSGGHVDSAVPTMGNFLPPVKSGQLRVVGVADSQRSKFFPDVPTLAEQGYKVNMSTIQGMNAPAGTPKEIVDVISASVKKSMTDSEFMGKLAEMAMEPSYMDAAAYAKFWDDMDAQVKPLMALGVQK